MPYGTHRIQGINRGQQVLQQKCAVLPSKLTDSSSLVAVLWLYQDKTDLQVFAEKHPVFIPVFP